MKAALLIPVFNHAGSLEQVVESLRPVVAGLPEIGEFVIVDDGCTDGTPAILKRLEAAGGITVLRHETNRGKGRALMTGFRYAADRGFTHVITIDADGQHEPTDAAKLLEAAKEHPDDLVIGCRDMDSAGSLVPSWSKKGRDISRFWLRVQTGQDIPDSQCGLRVYPLRHVLAAKYRFGRFDFETEVLARMAWGHVHVRSVPIKCIYFPPGKRVTHFRPYVDTLRGIRANVFLVGRRLAPLPFRRLVGTETGAASFGRWWKWATWRDAIRESLRAGSSNSELASAFALGIFVGLTPLYMLQTILAIYLSRRLHLNVLAAVLGSQISIPPLAPVWGVLSYQVGHWLSRGQWHVAPTFLVGNILLALTMAVVGLFAARTVLYFVRVAGAPQGNAVVDDSLAAEMR